jgi:hypothetical protein
VLKSKVEEAENMISEFINLEGEMAKSETPPEGK